MILRLPSPEFYLYQYKTNRGGGLSNLHSCSYAHLLYTPAVQNSVNHSYGVIWFKHPPRATNLSGKTRTPYRCGIIDAIPRILDRNAVIQSNNLLFIFR